MILILVSNVRIGDNTKKYLKFKKIHTKRKLLKKFVQSKSIECKFCYHILQHFFLIIATFSMKQLRWICVVFSPSENLQRKLVKKYWIKNLQCKNSWKSCFYDWEIGKLNSSVFRELFKCFRYFEYDN